MLPALLALLIPAAPVPTVVVPPPAPPAPGVVMLEPLRPGQEPPAAAVVVSSSGLVVAPLDRVGQRKRLTLYLGQTDERTGMVVYRDEELGLALVRTESAKDLRPLDLAVGSLPLPGTKVTVHGVEGGLPWRTGPATVVSAGTGPWGQMARGFLVCDGGNDGTAADAGAAVLAEDGTLVGVHLGRLRAAGAPPNRFVVAGTDLLRAFLDRATLGMPLARVSVRASIPRAEVFLDGAAVGRAPVSVDAVTVGWHTLRVQAPGFAPQERLVHAALLDAASVQVDLTPAALLRFQGLPEGATVSLDGAPAVPVTADVVPLPPGPHRAELQAPGFRRQAWRGALVLGEVKNVDIALVKEHGLLSVNSEPPGATVLVDGKEAGTTPLSGVKLKPGMRTLELRLAHHRPARLDSVNVKDAESLDLGTLKLVPLPARMVLAPDVAQSDDEVLLDGHRVSGHSWKVEPGYHDIEVRRSWHLPGKLRVLMGPGEERSVAPRPEEVPEYRERKWKVAAAGAGVAVAVVGVLTGLALVGGGVGLVAGGLLAYDRYHRATNQPEIEVSYRTANGLLWGGATTLAASLAPVVVAVAAGVVTGVALLTLPSDPTEKLRKPDAEPNRGGAS